MGGPIQIREDITVKERLTVVTRKGQITIPVEMRRALDLKEGDTVAVVLADDHVRLTKSESVVERTAGTLQSNRPPLTAEEERALAEAAIAQEVLEREA